MNWTQKNDFLFVKAIPLTAIAAVLHSQLPFEAWFVTNNLQIYLDVFRPTFLPSFISLWALELLNEQKNLLTLKHYSLYASKRMLFWPIIVFVVSLLGQRQHHVPLGPAIYILWCRGLLCCFVVPHTLTHLGETVAQSTAIIATRKPFLKIIYSLFHQCDASSAVCIVCDHIGFVLDGTAYREIINDYRIKIIFNLIEIKINKKQDKKEYNH